ncbi:unnamed protein product, partial [Tilletia caries]
MPLTIKVRNGGAAPGARGEVPAPAIQQRIFTSIPW